MNPSKVNRSLRSLRDIGREENEKVFQELTAENGMVEGGEIRNSAAKHVLSFFHHAMKKTNSLEHIETSPEEESKERVC